MGKCRSGYRADDENTIGESNGTAADGATMSKDAPVSDGEASRVVFATLLRSEGDTGVHAHMRVFSSWLSENSYKSCVLTPFEAEKTIMVPVLVMRRVLRLFSKGAAVWWYRKWHYILLRKVLRRFLAGASKCVIYAQCPVAAKAAMEARSSGEQRIVLVTHFNVSQADEWVKKGDIIKDSKLYRSIVRMEEVILPQMDGMVYVSEFMRDTLWSRMPALAEVPYAVVPNFVEVLAAGDSIGVSRDLITIGTLEPRKNQKYAVEILAEARRMGRPLSLTIVGNGVCLESLERLAKRLNVYEDISFVGYVPDAYRLIGNHRAYLHVAHMESFGIVIIEAMACGRPVFAPAVGGVTEIISDGKDGRYIPLGDACEAARIILECFADDAKLDKMGCAGSAVVMERYSAEVVAPKLMEFLSEC